MVDEAALRTMAQRIVIKTGLHLQYAHTFYSAVTKTMEELRPILHEYELAKGVSDEQS